MAFVTVGVRFGLSSLDPAGSEPDTGLSGLVAAAMAAERAGADAVLVDGRDARFDPFVMLGALAAVTSRALLGCVATPVDERHPAVLAKTVAALDVCSAGRALACLGPGARYPKGGLDELGEALDVVRAMLDTVAPSYAGRHFAIHGAWNEPRAARKTPVPVGVLAPEPGTAVAGQSLAITGDLADVAGRHGNCCFVEVAAGDIGSVRKVSRKLPPGFPVIALVAAEADAAPSAVAEAVARVAAAGCSGVVIDWRRAPAAPLIAETVATVRRAIPYRDVTS